MIRLIDYLFLLRPMLILPIWATYFSGVYAFSQSRILILNNFEFSISWLNFVGFSIFIGAMYVLNQISDVKSDAKNKKLYILPNGKITKFSALIYSLILIVISVFFAFKLSRPAGWSYISALIVLGVGYNFNPMRWSSQPLAGLLVHIFGGWFSFSAGWLNSGGVLQESLIPAIPIIFGFCAVYLLTTLPDREGDKVTRKITFAVRFGIIPTLNCSVGFMVLCLLSARYFQNYLIMLAVVPSLIMVIRARIYYNQKSDTLQSIRFTILYFLIVIGYKFPILLIFTTVVIMLTRVYYQLRFGKKYPVLR